MSFKLSEKNVIFIGPSYMPDGRPVPELLNEKEAIQFLRLDIDGPANPKQTLRYYRNSVQHILDWWCGRRKSKTSKYGRHLWYLKSKLEAFLKRKPKKENRKKSQIRKKIFPQLPFSDGLIKFSYFFRKKLALFGESRYPEILTGRSRLKKVLVIKWMEFGKQVVG